MSPETNNQLSHQVQKNVSVCLINEPEAKIHNKKNMLSMQVCTRFDILYRYQQPKDHEVNIKVFEQLVIVESN
jgi:hypothetical protein